MVLLCAAILASLWTGATGLAFRTIDALLPRPAGQGISVVLLPSALAFACLYLRVWRLGRHGPAGTTLLVATLVGWLRVAVILMVAVPGMRIYPWIFAAPLIPVLEAFGKFLHGIGVDRNEHRPRGVGALCVAAGWLVVAAFFLGWIQPWESPRLGIESRWNRISGIAGSIGQLVSAVYVGVLAFGGLSREEDPPV